MSAILTETAEESRREMELAAQDYVQRVLRPQLEPLYSGQVLAYHPESGEWEISPDGEEAGARIRARHPGALCLFANIGKRPRKSPLAELENADMDPEMKRQALRALGFYEEVLGPKLEPEHMGEEIVLHLESLDWEVSRDPVVAIDKMHERHPGERFFFMKVGEPIMRMPSGWSDHADWQP